MADSMPVARAAEVMRATERKVQEPKTKYTPGMKVRMHADGSTWSLVLVGRNVLTKQAHEQILSGKRRAVLTTSFAPGDTWIVESNTTHNPTQVDPAHRTGRDGAFQQRHCFPVTSGDKECTFHFIPRDIEVHMIEELIRYCVPKKEYDRPAEYPPISTPLEIAYRKNNGVDQAGTSVGSARCTFSDHIYYDKYGCDIRRGLHHKKGNMWFQYTDVTPAYLDALAADLPVVDTSGPLLPHIVQPPTTTKRTHPDAPVAAKRPHVDIPAVPVTGKDARRFVSSCIAWHKTASPFARKEVDRSSFLEKTRHTRESFASMVADRMRRNFVTAPPTDDAPGWKICLYNTAWLPETLQDIVYRTCNTSAQDTGVVELVATACVAESLFPSIIENLLA